MSDVMPYGVLRMPYEMAMNDELSRLQFYGRAQVAADRLEKVEAAAGKLFTAKGRHHSQIAMCELGELLGYPVVWPEKQLKVTP